MSTTVINDFKDLRKIIGEVTKKNPAKTRYQQQAEKMGYPLPLVEDRGMSPGEMNRLRKAYAGIKTMDPTKPPGKKLLAFMRKLSKDQLQDIAGAGINFLSLLAVSNLIRMGIKPEDIKYTKAEANENDFIKKLKIDEKYQFNYQLKNKAKQHADASDHHKSYIKPHEKAGRTHSFKGYGASFKSHGEHHRAKTSHNDAADAHSKAKKSHDLAKSAADKGDHEAYKKHSEAAKKHSEKAKTQTKHATKKSQGQQYHRDTDVHRHIPKKHGGSQDEGVSEQGFVKEGPLDKGYSEKAKHHDDAIKHHKAHRDGHDEAANHHDLEQGGHPDSYRNRVHAKMQDHHNDAYDGHAKAAKAHKLAKSAAQRGDNENYKKHSEAAKKHSDAAKKQSEHTHRKSKAGGHDTGDGDVHNHISKKHGGSQDEGVSEQTEAFNEGVFSRIAVDIDHGDNAQKVAKKYKLDLKVVKQMFIDIKKVQQASPNFIRKNENDPLKEGKYLTYSDLLLKKSRLVDLPSTNKKAIAAVNKEIEKEMKKLGISEEILGEGEIGDVEKLMKKGMNAKQIGKKKGYSPRRIKALAGMMQLMKQLQKIESVDEKKVNWLLAKKPGEKGVGVAAYDKTGKMVGYYPDMKTAKKFAPGLKYVQEAYGAAPAGAISAISKMVDKKYNISKIAKETGLSPKMVTTIKKYIDDINDPNSAFNSKYSKATQGESRSKQVKEEQERAKQSPFKLKSQQYPRAVPIDSEGYGIRHAIVDDIVSACETFGMITDKELQVEQVQKALGKKGFISYNKSELEDVFEERETQRIILSLESELEEQEDTKYTKRQIQEKYNSDEELEFLKPDGMKSVGPILKLSGKTYNVKDKFTGRSFTYKYAEEENEMNYEKSWTKPGDGLKSYKELAEVTFSRSLVNNAIKIAHKMSGNMTGAYKKIEKIKKGLADDPRVKAALQSANESFKKATAEGKLPPALQKAIDKKKGKKVDDDEDQAEGQFWGQKKMSKAHIAKLKKSGAVMLQKKEKSGSVGRITLPKGHKDIAKYKKQGYKQISIESMEEWVSKNGTRRRVKDEDKRISKLKEWEKAAEAEGDKAAYQKFFNSALKKFGVSSPDELEGDKKKKFFNYVDKNWTADHEEEVDVHKSYKVDGRRKNFREKMKKLGYIKGI